MESTKLGYIKTFNFEGKETIIKNIKYEGNETYTVTCEDVTEMSVYDFIEKTRQINFDLQWQKLENKRLEEENNVLRNRIYNNGKYNGY